MREEKKLAEVLAGFVVSRPFESLPAPVVERAKTFAMDLVGCMIGASGEEPVEALAEVVKAEGGSPQSTVVNHGFRTSAMQAALMNGTMGHVFDFDDNHREGVIHSSVAVFPAVFALAERRRASGRELIRAFVLGSEVMIRLAESFLGRSQDKGFHPTGTMGVFGAAAGCSALLGLDAGRTASALGLAGSFASDIMKWRREGSWQKPLRPGHAAMSGLLAASPAEKGFVGARSLFEEPDGVIRLFSFEDRYDWPRSRKTWASTGRMADTSIKMYACCRFCATSVTGALDLYRRGVRAPDVAHVRVKAGRQTIDSLCFPPDVKRRPATHVDAQFSLPYTVAVALCKNRVGVDEFRKEMLADTEVLALADKISGEIDTEADALYPAVARSTLVVTLNNGRTVEARVDHPKGDPTNPATAEEVADKFALLTERLIGLKKGKKIMEAIAGLEEMTDVARLGGLLAGRRREPRRA